ncbi:hypothetical protein BC628DRAFT_36928 [Trametes gibbosa]|nr:hypothetical protein BC628DRAFT_36928 [Trametes gibbosa]
MCSRIVHIRRVLLFSPFSDHRSYFRVREKTDLGFFVCLFRPKCSNWSVLCRSARRGRRPRATRTPSLPALHRNRAPRQAKLLLRGLSPRSVLFGLFWTARDYCRPRTRRAQGPILNAGQWPPVPRRRCVAPRGVSHKAYGLDPSPRSAIHLDPRRSSLAPYSPSRRAPCCLFAHGVWAVVGAAVPPPSPPLVPSARTMATADACVESSPDAQHFTLPQYTPNAVGCRAPRSVRACARWPCRRSPRAGEPEPAWVGAPSSARVPGTRLEMMSITLCGRSLARAASRPS